MIVSAKTNKNGFSLVEVMVSVVLLVVLVIGGAAVMYQTGGGIQRQQNKREAIVAMETVMEQYWNQSYPDLQTLGGSTINDTITVNGIAMDVTVDVSAEAADSEGNMYVELKIDVDHLGSSDDVVITTRRYEFGISRAAL